MSLPRLTAAKAIARDAGVLATRFYRDLGALDVQSKGAQDLVTNADLEVETFVRQQIAQAFPDDSILGEEHGQTPGKSGWMWIIDPIDGTANFVNGIPQWCVILTCVQNDETQLGVIFEPTTDEMFWAVKGQGAYVNGKPMTVRKTEGLHDGSVGVGMCGPVEGQMTAKLITQLSDHGSMFFRNASGGLMLAYVAAGRLIGYCEPRMQAWDCLAGQLMVVEAGGMTEPLPVTQRLSEVGRVIASTLPVFDTLCTLCDSAFHP